MKRVDPERYTLVYMPPWVGMEGILGYICLPGCVCRVYLPVYASLGGYVGVYRTVVYRTGCTYGRNLCAKRPRRTQEEEKPLRREASILPNSVERAGYTRQEAPESLPLPVSLLADVVLLVRTVLRLMTERCPLGGPEALSHHPLHCWRTVVPLIFNSCF